MILFVCFNQSLPRLLLMTIWRKDSKCSLTLNQCRLVQTRKQLSVSSLIVIIESKQCHFLIHKNRSVLKKLLSFLAILSIELILLSGLTATQVKISPVFNFKGNLLGNFYSQEISSEMEKILATSSAARPETLNFDSPEMGANQVQSVNSSLVMTNEAARKEAEVCAAIYESTMDSKTEADKSRSPGSEKSESPQPNPPKTAQGGSFRTPSTYHQRKGVTQPRKGSAVPSTIAGGFENIYAPATEEPPPYDRDKELDQILAGRGYGSGRGAKFMAVGAFELPKFHQSTVESYSYAILQAPRRETWTHASIVANTTYLEEGGIIREVIKYTTGTIAGMGAVLFLRMKPVFRSQRQLITSGISKGGYDNYYENPLVLNFLTDEEAVRILEGVASLIHIRGCGDSSHADENDVRRWVVQQWAQHHLKGFKPFTLLYLIRQPTGAEGNIKAQNSYSLVICSRASPPQLRSIWDSFNIQESSPRQIEIGGLHFEMYRSAEKLIAMRYGSWTSLEGSACVIIKKLSPETTLDMIIRLFPTAILAFWDHDEDREAAATIIVKQEEGSIPDLTVIGNSFHPIEAGFHECTGVTTQLRELRKFYTDNDSIQSKWIKQGEAKRIEEKGKTTPVKEGEWHVVTNRNPIKTPLVPIATLDVKSANSQSISSIETSLTTRLDEQLGLIAVGHNRQFELILDRLDQGLARHAQYTSTQMSELSTLFAGEVTSLAHTFNALLARVEQLEMINSKKRSSEEIEQQASPPRRRSNSPLPSTGSDKSVMGMGVAPHLRKARNISLTVASVETVDVVKGTQLHSESSLDVMFEESGKGKMTHAEETLNERKGAAGSASVQPAEAGWMYPERMFVEVQTHIAKPSAVLATAQNISNISRDTAAEARLLTGTLEKPKKADLTLEDTMEVELDSTEHKMELLNEDFVSQLVTPGSMFNVNVASSSNEEGNDSTFDQRMDFGMSMEDHSADDGISMSTDSTDDPTILETRKSAAEVYDDGSLIIPMFDQHDGYEMVMDEQTHSQEEDEPMQITHNEWCIKVGPDRGLSLNSLGQYATPIGRGATATIPIPEGSKIKCYGEVITFPRGEGAFTWPVG